ncbi:hypothetical protein B0T16DRAFT_452551 [Cercophora newfieldiana]|uniref:Uncharacterized protein n=1 Tax=Cercophora newfieldiana TaxID=92897 RepID=A0AA39YS13_9PEZI|nr:hypothetical protein B0T16DRAFT_452551 [Cercophora newfieldiana]
MVSVANPVDDTAIHPNLDGLVLAHIPGLSTKEPPPNSIATSTQHMNWCAIPQAAAEAQGMPSSENLVAMWSAQEEGPSSLRATPMVHIPHCRLEVTSFPDLSPRRGGPAGKIERVALPGHVFRWLLSQANLPDATAAVPRHFDDDEEWVFSRCVLAEFSDLGEDEAARASEAGELCCWASLVAMRDGDQRAWDIGVLVHKVFASRRPGCRCGP